MAVKITSIDDAIEDNGVKILVHGLAGSGKTVLCATTGAPTLIINVEGGLRSLKGAPKYIETVKVKTLDEFQEIHDMLLEAVESGNQKYKWVAIDSTSEIAETVLMHELEMCNDPRKSYPAFQAKITQLIKDFRDLPSYHVVMTAKQTMVKDDYTGITLRSPQMPGNKLGPAVPYLYDEVFALRVEKDEEGDDYRIIQTNRDIMYEAKDRSGMLDLFERPNLKHILAKIEADDSEIVDDSPPEVEESVEDDSQLEHEPEVECASEVDGYDDDGIPF